MSLDQVVEEDEDDVHRCLPTITQRPPSRSRLINLIATINWKLVCFVSSCLLVAGLVLLMFALITISSFNQNQFELTVSGLLIATGFSGLLASCCFFDEFKDVVDDHALDEPNTTFRRTSSISSVASSPGHQFRTQQLVANVAKSNFLTVPMPYLSTNLTSLDGRDAMRRQSAESNVSGDSYNFLPAVST